MQPNRVEFEQEKMEGTTKLEGTSDDALWFVLGRQGLGRRGLGFAFWSVWVTKWVFFFNMGFWFRWDFGGHGGGVVVVTGQWRRGDRG